MPLISIQGWDKVLLIVIEDNGQPWLMRTKIDYVGVPLIAYTHKQFIEAWNPSKEIKQ